MIRRPVALALTLALALPTPAFALRVSNAGQEHSPAARRLARTLVTAGLEEDADRVDLAPAGPLTASRVPGYIYDTLVGAAAPDGGGHAILLTSERGQVNLAETPSSPELVREALARAAVSLDDPQSDWIVTSSVRRVGQRLTTVIRVHSYDETRWSAAPPSPQYLESLWEYVVRVIATYVMMTDQPEGLLKGLGISLDLQGLVAEPLALPIGPARQSHWEAIARTVPKALRARQLFDGLAAEWVDPARALTEVVGAEGVCKVRIALLAPGGLEETTRQKAVDAALAPLFKSVQPDVIQTVQGPVVVLISPRLWGPKAEQFSESQLSDIERRLAMTMPNIQLTVTMNPLQADDAEAQGPPSSGSWMLPQIVVQRFGALW